MANSKQRTKNYDDDKSYSKNGSKGKGRRNGRYDDRRATNDSKGASYVGAAEGKENDPNWYKQIPQIFEDATKLSFYNPTGVEFSWGASEYVKQSRVPGIMVLETVITPGTSSDANSGLNLAAINTFEMTRKALNKPNPEYEAADMIIASYAKMNLFAIYANICRMFGLLSKWDAENYYTPRSLLRTIYGMRKQDYEYAIANLANLRARFNQLIYKSSFVFLPTTFRLMERYAWLFMNVFRDHDTSKSQFYAHRMHGYYQWDETTYETGSACVYHAFKYQFTGPAGHENDPVDVIGYYLDVFDECLESLRNSSSIRIMDSDMRKAFENNNGWQLAWLDEGYTTDYTISDEVLMQIENTSVMRTVFGSGTYTDGLLTKGNDITQDVDHNFALYTPYLDTADDATQEAASAYAAYGGSQIINVHSQTVSPEMIMVATRGKFTFNYDSENERAYLLVGSDYVNRIYISVSPDSDNVPEWQTRINTSGSGLVLLPQRMFWFSAFDWAPGLYIMEVDDQDFVKLDYFVCEYDNYTTVDYQTLTNLHRVAILSMWYAPDFGAWSTI